MAPVSDDVRRFVLTSIASVPHLEALLLFHAEPALVRSAAEVAGLLYLSDRATAELLEQLCERRLLALASKEPPTYRYAPPDEAVSRVVDRLAVAYSGNLVEITTLIHDATQKSAQRFADAFKLRKDR